MQSSFTPEPGGMPPIIPPGAPPPIAPAPSPGGRPRGNLWLKVAIVLAVLLAVSLASQFSHFARGLTSGSRGGRVAQEHFEEVLLQNNASRNKIVVLDVSGLITGESVGRHGQSMVDFFSNKLRLAGEDESVKAVLLKVDSPGGEVLASDEIYRAIADFQNDYRKPIVASMSGLAASGGYYVSAPCRWIVANELTITGSIGVILHSYNYRGLLNKVGVRPLVFKSGKFKDMLSGDRNEEEILPEERRMVQALVDETFTRFKQAVAKGRSNANEINGDQGRKLAGNWEEFADGRVLSGNQAHELGFVDELGNFDTAVERARMLAGIPDANLVGYQRPFDLGGLFRMFGQSEGGAVKIDLGMQLPKLEVGRLYFLSPTVLH